MLPHDFISPGDDTRFAAGLSGADGVAATLFVTDFAAA